MLHCYDKIRMGLKIWLLTECSLSRLFNSADFIFEALDIDGAFVISLSISRSQRRSLRGSPTKLCVRVDGLID